MAFLLGLGGGSGSRRRVAAKGAAGAARGRRSSAVAAAPRPVRQLYWKLRSRLRPKRHASGAAARFGYDLQSYSRNFDDGLVSGHHHRFQAPVVALAS
ncbi:uncharacterized protein LOC121055583 [Oryza brachyantha]|uniref:uncharacterized protein LOC121055583 n=1 Tax=Oryza brachyantha TaxID=4533 RepID=UPI001ADA3968|nr:uncharacterized protein LOC121055583 [Oryza brachyantha]